MSNHSHYTPAIWFWVMGALVVLMAIALVVDFVVWRYPGMMR